MLAQCPHSINCNLASLAYFAAQTNFIPENDGPYLRSLFYRVR